MGNIKFSITIPSFKGRYLAEAIESCLNQTYQNFEVIIVDDCSPEDLGRIVSPYLNDNRVRYYRNNNNCGAINVVDNWNICLSYCTGDYVICMGDDDRLLPNCLVEYAKLIARHPNLRVFHAWTEIIDEESNYLSMQQPRPEWESSLSILWNRWNGRDKQYIGDFCYNVELLRLKGGYINFPMAWGADVMTAVMMARNGGIANMQTIGFQYRQSRYTITSGGDSEIKFSAFEQEKKWLESFLEKYEKDLNKCVPFDFVVIEQKYLIAIRDEFHQHYLVEYKDELTKSMTGHLFRVFKWLRLRKEYNLSVSRILYSCLLAFFRRYHGR